MDIIEEPIVLNQAPVLEVASALHALSFPLVIM